MSVKNKKIRIFGIIMIVISTLLLPMENVHAATNYIGRGVEDGWTMKDYINASSNLGWGTTSGTDAYKIWTTDPNTDFFSGNPKIYTTNEKAYGKGIPFADTWPGESVLRTAHQGDRFVNGTNVTYNNDPSAPVSYETEVADFYVGSTTYIGSDGIAGGESGDRIIFPENVQKYILVISLMTDINNGNRPAGLHIGTGPVAQMDVAYWVEEGDPVSSHHGDVESQTYYHNNDGLMPYHIWRGFKFTPTDLPNWRHKYYIVNPCSLVGNSVSWEPVCALCGQQINVLHYSSRNALMDLPVVDTTGNVGYGYTCRLDGGLEQGAIYEHKCWTLSPDAYSVNYNINTTDTRASGHTNATAFYYEVSDAETDYLINKYISRFSENVKESAVKELKNRIKNLKSTYDASTGLYTYVIDNKTVTTDRKVAQNGFYRPGYIFTGWNTQADGNGIAINPGTDLVAVFSDSNYANIRNNLINGGNNSSFTLYAQWEAIPTKLHVEVQDGFNGGAKYNGVSVYETSGIRDQSYTLNADNVTFPSGYKVEYDVNGGVLSDGSSIVYAKTYITDSKIKNSDAIGVYQGGSTLGTYTYGTATPEQRDHVDTVTITFGQNAVVLPGASKTNAIFIGWYDESGQYVGKGGDTYIPTENIKLIAKYDSLGLIAEEVYYYNDGTHSFGNSQKDSSGNPINYANGGRVPGNGYASLNATGAVNLKTNVLNASSAIYSVYINKSGTLDTSASGWLLVSDQNKSGGALTGDSLNRTSKMSAASTITITVPGVYHIEAKGAQGGTYGSHSGGKGGVVSGDVFLEKGEVITYRTGGQGSTYMGGNGGTKGASGGGYTIVSSNKKGTLLIAGGGGGGSDAGAGGDATTAPSNKLTSASTNGVRGGDTAEGGAGGGGGYAAGKGGTVKSTTTPGSLTSSINQTQQGDSGDTTYKITIPNCEKYKYITFSASFVTVGGWNGGVNVTTNKGSVTRTSGDTGFTSGNIQRIGYDYKLDTSSISGSVVLTITGSCGGTDAQQIDCGDWSAMTRDVTVSTSELSYGGTNYKNTTYLANTADAHNNAAEGAVIITAKSLYPSYTTGDYILTDIYARDTQRPRAIDSTSVVVTYSADGNVSVTWAPVEDNSDKSRGLIPENTYSYYVEAKINPTVNASGISSSGAITTASIKSPAVQVKTASELAGYYWKFDTNGNGDANYIRNSAQSFANGSGYVWNGASEHYAGNNVNFSQSPSAVIGTSYPNGYFYVAPVDVAGNIGDTIKIEITGVPLGRVLYNTNKLTYILDKNNLYYNGSYVAPGKEQVGGYSEANRDGYLWACYYSVDAPSKTESTAKGLWFSGTTKTLKAYGGDAPSVASSGSTLIGWNTKADGTGVWISGPGNNTMNWDSLKSVLVKYQTVTVYAIWNDPVNIMVPTLNPETDPAYLNLRGGDYYNRGDRTIRYIPDATGNNTKTIKKTIMVLDSVTGESGSVIPKYKTYTTVGDDYVWTSDATVTTATQSSATGGYRLIQNLKDMDSGALEGTITTYTGNSGAAIATQKVAMTGLLHTETAGTVSTLNIGNDAGKPDSMFSVSQKLLKTTYDVQGTFRVSGQGASRSVLQNSTGAANKPGAGCIKDTDTVTLRVDRTPPVIKSFTVSQERLEDISEAGVENAITSSLMTTTFVVNATDYANAGYGPYINGHRTDTAGIEGVYLYAYDTTNPSDGKVFPFVIDTINGYTMHDNHVIDGQYVLEVNLYEQMENASDLTYKVYVVDNAGNVSNINEHGTPIDTPRGGKDPEDEEGEEEIIGTLVNFSLKTVIYNDEKDSPDATTRSEVFNQGEGLTFFRTGDTGHVEVWAIGHVPFVSLNFGLMGKESADEIIAGTLHEKFNLGIDGADTYSDYVRIIPWTRANEIHMSSFRYYDKESGTEKVTYPGEAKYNELAYEAETGIPYALHFVIDGWLSDGMSVRMPPEYHLTELGEDEYGEMQYEWEMWEYAVTAQKSSAIAEAKNTYILWGRKGVNTHNRVTHETQDIKKIP